MGELGSREILHFVADDADTALVGGVEFEDSGAVKGGPEEGFGEGEDCGCFSCAGGSVEEHMGELRVLFYCFNCSGRVVYV